MIWLRLKNLMLLLQNLIMQRRLNEFWDRGMARKEVGSNSIVKHDNKRDKWNSRNILVTSCSYRQHNDDLCRWGKRWSKSRESGRRRDRNTVFDQVERLVSHTQHMGIRGILKSTKGIIEILCRYFWFFLITRNTYNFYVY